METVNTIAAVREQVGRWRSEGRRIAFVPTMGNLHRGHVSLIEAARRHGERFVASIFVNPMQFGPNEDFAHYPRTPADDERMLAEAGCNLMFMPDVAEKMSVDAFDSRSALPASARLLRNLRARFGNLGLAAAAYNAGPKRVADWLDGRSSLPKETQDYVYLITGRLAAHWHSVKPQTVVYRVPGQVPCHRLQTFASVERAERAQQEQVLAEEIRLAELRAREAARRLAEEQAKQRKVVARSARLQIASRVQAGKSAARRQAPMRLAQAKR